MKLAVGSDERTPLTEFVVQELRARGHELELYGALAGDNSPWPQVAEKTALRVAVGKCEQAVLFCWTGTGVSIAANKLPGIRAALCPDGETARGARRWNHANVLVMSLRLTSPAVAGEILDAWLGTPGGGGEDEENVAMVTSLERKYGEKTT